MPKNFIHECTNEISRMNMNCECEIKVTIVIGNKRQIF